MPASWGSVPERLECSLILIFFKCFFLSLVRIPFFIAPKLSQNNFKNQIVWEVLVGEVLVVG